MGGKGRKRREKNYKAAHGGKSRLPPPPVASSVDALPSKLRQLMSFSSPPNSNPGSAKVAAEGTKRKRGDDGGGDNKPDDKKVGSKDIPESKPTAAAMEGSDGEHGEIDTRKKKRRKKQVSDLRFEAELGVVGSKRKERKKMRLQERKQKLKKGKAGRENQDFPSKDVVGFGEVVQAPPKLVTLPKAFKSTTHNASQERIRLKAVEAYRNKKGWTSRLGVNVPLPGSTEPSSTMS